MLPVEVPLDLPFFKAPGAFILRDPGPESSLSPIEHD